jgi:hypothetical protein
MIPRPRDPAPKEQAKSPVIEKRWYEVNRITQGPEILAVPPIDHNRFIPPLKQMPSQAVLHVVANCVGGLHPVHPRRQVRLGLLQKQMVLVSHKHKGMTPPAGSLTGLSQHLEKHQPILLIQKNWFQLISTIHHMVNGSHIFQSRLSWHEIAPINTEMSIGKA